MVYGINLEKQICFSLLASARLRNVLPTRDGVNLKICYFGLEIESNFFFGIQTFRIEKAIAVKRYHKNKGL